MQGSELDLRKSIAGDKKKSKNELTSGRTSKGGVCVSNVLLQIMMYC